jgi:hypothetical protein
MKQCPKCSRVYADNSLRFCLDDGGALISTAAAQPTMRIESRGNTAPRTEVLPTSQRPNPPSRSVVPWVIAGVAILVAGVVVMASLGVLIFARKTTTVNASPSETRTPGSSPNPSPTIINLAGTRWTDSYANISAKAYYFSPNGTINNSSSSTWKQNGRSVILEFNDGYARYEGTINANGTQIDYKAKNKLNFEWTATITRDN